MLWILHTINTNTYKFNPGTRKSQHGSDQLSFSHGERSHPPYEPYLTQPSWMVPQIINHSLLFSPKVFWLCLHCHISPSLPLFG